jgi:hypothetical protein
MCAAVAVAASACGSEPGTLHSAQSGGQCRLSAGTLPARFPGFTQYQALSHMAYPGHAIPSAPQALPQRDYLCGEAEGFLTDISLTGKYRQENNEQAQSLGYTVGKWPSTPLHGSIVGQQRHRALEIYVSAFQFTSARAAEAFISPLRSGPRLAGGLAYLLRPRPLSAPRLPGVVAFTEPLGTNPAEDETDITVKLPLKNFVLVLALCGGESFDWSDAAPYWERVHTMVTAQLEGGKS